MGEVGASDADVSPGADASIVDRVLRLIDAETERWRPRPNDEPDREETGHALRELRNQ
jgi:hypothetical protein